MKFQGMNLTFKKKTQNKIIIENFYNLTRILLEFV